MDDTVTLLARDTACDLLPVGTSGAIGWPGYKRHWVGSFEDGLTELGLRAFAYEVEENDWFWPFYMERYWNDIPEEEPICSRCGGSGIEPKASDDRRTDNAQTNGGEQG